MAMTLREWGDALADALPGWGHLPPSNVRHHTRLVHKETGAALHVDVNSPEYMEVDGVVTEDARLEFSGDWPYGGDRFGRLYGVFRPTNAGDYHCTCSARRSPEAIARDVTRRILDKGFVEAYLTEIERLHRTLRNQQDKVEAAHQLAGALNLPTADSEDQMYPTLHLRGRYHASFRVDAHDSISIDVRSVPLDLALQIATLLQNAAQ